MSTAIITGASRGFGRALTAGLAAEGWTVIAAGRDRDRLEETRQIDPSRIVTVRGDVRELDHQRALVEAAEPRRRAGPAGSQRERAGPEPAADGRRARAVRALPRARRQRPRPAHPDPARPAAARRVGRTDSRRPELGRGRRGLSGMGRLRLVQGGARPADGRAGRRAAQRSPSTRFDPGDMRTDMHQRAFPGEDISDRPEPASVVPALLDCSWTRPPSGRYRAADLDSPGAAAMSVSTRSRPGATVHRRRGSRMPPGSAATAPPEARGLARDEVRLMVATTEVRSSTPASGGSPSTCDRGDLIVVNTSATVAAAVTGTRPAAGDVSGGRPLLRPGAMPPASGRSESDPAVDRRVTRRGLAPGERWARRRAIDLPHGVTLTLTRAWPDPPGRSAAGCGWPKSPWNPGSSGFLQREGRPITYDHIEGSWPLSDYQTIFAAEPGSAEMASAARPFSRRVVADLHRAGIAIAALTLHTGVSSLEADETPLPERYAVSAATAQAVNATRERGGRIVAAGTTVTRALESVARPRAESRARLGGHRPRHRT